MTNVLCIHFSPGDDASHATSPGLQRILSEMQRSAAEKQTTDAKGNPRRDREKRPEGVPQWNAQKLLVSDDEGESRIVNDVRFDFLVDRDIPPHLELSTCSLDSLNLNFLNLNCVSISLHRAIPISLQFNHILIRSLSRCHLFVNSTSISILFHFVSISAPSKFNLNSQPFYHPFSSSFRKFVERLTPLIAKEGVPMEGTLRRSPKKRHLPIATPANAAAAQASHPTTPHLAAASPAAHLVTSPGQQQQQQQQHSMHAFRQSSLLLNEQQDV